MCEVSVSKYFDENQDLISGPMEYKQNRGKGRKTKKVCFLETRQDGHLSAKTVKAAKMVDFGRKAVKDAK